MRLRKTSMMVALVALAGLSFGSLADEPQPATTPADTNLESVSKAHCPHHKAGAENPEDHEDCPHHKSDHQERKKDCPHHKANNASN